MVLLVKGTVKDIAVGSATGAVDTAAMYSTTGASVMNSTTGAGAAYTAGAGAT